MTVNGKECWSQSFYGPNGSQECGEKDDNAFKEESIAVKCEAESVDGKLTVRVHATLSSDTKDESFGIDNVVITKTSAGVAPSCASACAHVVLSSGVNGTCLIDMN